MRVHNCIIRRRAEISSKRPYGKYLPELCEDFFHVCGYCGKHETHATKGFEIDHFVPGRLASERETDYTNLVYSCFTCNHKKLGQWPTEDKNIHNDGNIGLVDPATEEYDIHLERNADGAIIGKTSVGRYMCAKIFKFDIRPMKELWQYSEIEKLKKFIRENQSSLPADVVATYIMIDKQLITLRNYFFECKE